MHARVSADLSVSFSPVRLLVALLPLLHTACSLVRSKKHGTIRWSDAHLLSHKPRLSYHPPPPHALTPHLGPPTRLTPNTPRQPPYPFLHLTTPPCPHAHHTSFSHVAPFEFGLFLLLPSRLPVVFMSDGSSSHARPSVRAASAGRVNKEKTSPPFAAIAALSGTTPSAKRQRSGAGRSDGASLSGSPRGSTRMRVGSQFCHAHACKHFSPQWHYGSGSDPYTWCHSSYQASRRNDHTGIGLYHPTWDLWKQRLHDRDSTGSSIVLLRQRPDIQALCCIANLCDTNRSWRHRRDVLFSLAFVLRAPCCEC